MLDGFISFRDRTLRVVRWCAPGAAGALLGGLFVLWWSQTLASLGASLATASGLVVAASLGTALGGRAWGRALTEAQRGGRLAVLALWTTLLPMIVPGPIALLQYFSAESLSTPAAEFLFSLLAGVVVLTTPHYFLAQMLTWPGGSRAHNGREMRCRQTWFGFALGLLALPTWGLSLGGSQVIAACLAVAAVLSGVWMMWPQGDQGTPAAAGSRRTELLSGLRASTHLTAADVAVAIVAGGLFALSQRVTSQLWMTGLYCGFALCAGFATGVVLTAAAVSWSGRAGRILSDRTGVAVIAAAAGVVTTGCFPWLVDLALQINARASSVVWIVGLRAVISAVAAIPAGMVFGAIVAGGESSPTRSRGSVVLLLAALGWVFGSWTFPEARQLTWAILGAASGAALVSGVRSLRSRRWGRGSLVTAAVGASVCAVAPWLIGRFDPSVSSRLLFSTRLAAAAHSSADNDLLLALDESRLLRVEAGRESVWTVWKHRGDSLVLRENGQPQGQLTLDLSVTPAATAELMSAVVPLTVHPQPDHVLVVGLGSSGTLRHSLEFPIRTLTCWEMDEDLSQLVRETVHGPQAEYFDDPRLTLMRVNGMLGSAAKPRRKYDVILLNERQPSSWRTVGTRSVESFQRWQGHLNDDGWLCVRFGFGDFGATPLLDLTRTLAAVFPQVLVWESAPGELLLLASPQESVPFDEDFLGRFETPQVRRALGRIGADCSLPLSLVTVTGDELLEAGAGRGRVVTAGSAHFEYTLPVETARWGAKSAELQVLLQPVARTALSRCPECSARTSLQQRLADVRKQREVIAEFPDHYWAYRKSLRERLQERPRSVIQQLSHELHPEDQRRQDYLQALGAAATSRDPTVDDLNRVAAFAEPFDPLVSPFADREIARLLQQLNPRAVDVELQHWLRSVYFSPGFDRSVRGATAALQLIVDHPEVIEDAARRWDQINSLLAVLKERWTLRSQQPQTSRFEAADVAATLETAQQALDYLRETALLAGIDPEWAELRCRVVDRTLIRALRSHHAKQVVKLKARERQQAAREQSNLQTQ